MGHEQAERGGGANLSPTLSQRYSGSGGNDAAVGSNACLRSSAEAARRRAVPTLTRSGPHKREFIFRNHCVTCSRNIRGNLTAFDDDTMGGWRWSDSILDTTTSCGGVITRLLQSSANLHPQGAYVTRGMDGSKWTGTIDTCLRVRDTRFLMTLW